MTDIEQKALALLNEHSDYEVIDLDEAQYSTAIQALCRAIEQHEAFRQEVSDAVEDASNATGLNGASRAMIANRFARFIIAKPDPLVEVLNDMEDGRAGPTTESYAACLRAALASRGLQIVEVGHD